MDFRIRPSSKRSDQSERSLVELPMPRNFQPTGGEIRNILMRMETLESNLSNHQDLWRRERDISNAGYLEVQKKLDMLEYKAFTNEKDIKKLLQISFDRGPSQQQLAITDNSRAFSQNEISNIKQALYQERQSHKEYAKHQNEIMEQMNRRQMRTESELRELLARQRQDYDSRFSDQIEEIRNNENLKQQKIENQYEMMKGMISNTQRKILGEFERKLRNETVVKDFIEDKISELKEQIAMEQKGMIVKEGKFVREIKESIESIFSIIKNTQKELTEELNETQKIAANNFKRLSMTVELVKQKLTEQMAALTEENASTQNELVDMKNYVNMKLQQNREIIMELEEQNNYHSQKQSRAGTKGFADAGNSQHSFSKGDHIDQSSKATSNLQKQFNQWKSITEQKNLNVFKEISNTLKTMKLQWKKESDGLTAEVDSFKESLTNVKKSVPLEIKKSVQTIITIFNNQFDTLAQELDTLTEMIALSKKQTEKLAKEEIKKSQASVLKEIKELLKNSQKQAILLIDKGLLKQEESMRTHIQQQNKFLKDFFTQKNSSLESELEQVAQSSKRHQLNTSTQLQDFTLKLKSFNENYKDYLEEQRKEDLRKRIELEDNMRKNASNLMDLSYKKSQFLVDGMKQAIQMNIMKDKVSFEREVEVMREENEKKMFKTKQDIIEEITQKLDKINEEKESSEQMMHEAFDQQINLVKKTLSNEIGNSKLELAEKINELVERINVLKEEGSGSNEQLEGTVQSLKEAVWKIEAMSFSEQAKNKAIMDRLGEDIVDLSTNIERINIDMHRAAPPKDQQ